MALSNFVVSTLPEVQTINLPMSSSLAGQTFTENVWSVQIGYSPNPNPPLKVVCKIGGGAYFWDTTVIISAKLMST